MTAQLILSVAACRSATSWLLDSQDGRQGPIARRNWELRNQKLVALVIERDAHRDLTELVFKRGPAIIAKATVEGPHAA